MLKTFRDKLSQRKTQWQQHPRVQAVAKMPLIVKLNQFLFGKGLFSYLVVLPFLLITFYFAVIVTPRYETHMTVVLKDNEQNVQMTGLAAVLGSAGGASTSADDYLMIDYIQSYDMFQLLNQKFDLVQWYQSHDIDWISRLSSHPNHQDLLTYYQSMISATFNMDAQTIIITTQGYTADQSYQLAVEMAKILQEKVDDMNQELAKKRLQYSEQQMTMAREKLEAAQKTILEYQDKYNLLDPQQTIDTVVSIMSQLQGQLVEAQTQLIDMQAYMQPDSIAIISQQQKIKAIEQQIKTQKGELVGDADAQSKDTQQQLNKMMAEFEWLRTNAEFSLEVYKAATLSYETAKADVIKQERQFLVVQKPMLPDEPTLPHTWYNIISALIILLMLYGVVSLVIKIIREHKE